MEKPSCGAISVDRRGVTDWITLNRSERLNAFDHAMVDDLGHDFDSAGEDPACRVIVLRGAGPAFCAGDHHPPLLGLGGGPEGPAAFQRHPHQLACGGR